MLKALPRRVVSYFLEVKSEVEKIAWPTQKTVILYSVLVFVTCIVIAAYSGALDFGLTELVNALLSR